MRIQVGELLFRVAARLAKRPLEIFVRGNPRLNSMLWDVSYSLGVWRRLDRTDGPALPALAELIPSDARILDLGCGTSKNVPLEHSRYGHYHGVDISRQAIARARALNRPNTSFEVADILTYHTDDRYDAIFLREVLYYFPVGTVADLLRRCAGMLRPGGIIFVQLYDVVGEAGRGIVASLHTSGLVIENELRAPALPAAAAFVMRAARTNEGVNR